MIICLGVSEKAIEVLRRKINQSDLWAHDRQGRQMFVRLTRKLWNQFRLKQKQPTRNPSKPKNTQYTVLAKNRAFRI